MKSTILLLFLSVFSIAIVQAQEEAEYLMCTEILLDPPEKDDLSKLPPGMVARAVAFKPELGKYWTNGRSLRVGFIGGSETARSRVRKYAPEWSDVANIQFIFVEKGETDLRVSFTPGLGTWSMIGTDASRMPQYKPTINFGWFGSQITEADYRGNILHEFGHALGLLHEHQHPQGGIPWDKTKLYAYYRRTQGWDETTVDQQVLTTYGANRTQYTRYDPASIMHYPIPNSLTMGDFEIGMNHDLSPTDRAFMSKVYPRKATSSSRPVVTAPTRPSTNTGPNSKPSVPARPTTSTTNKPTAPVVATTLVIRDILPASQKREQVWVTVQGVTRSFVLDQSTAQSGKITFTLPKDGTYPYEVRTKTTFLKRVNGRIQETTLNGYGEGQVTVRRNAMFDLAIGKALNDRWFEVNLLTVNTGK